MYTNTMSFEFTANKLFVLAAIIIWLVIAVVGILGTPAPHLVEWVAIGLASFGIAFLV